MMKLIKNAHKAWSTWVSAALTALTMAYAEFVPALRNLIEPDQFLYVVMGMGFLITVVRFIDQGISKDD